MERRIRRKRSEEPGVSISARAITVSRERRADMSNQLDETYGSVVAGGVTPIAPPFDISKLLYMLSISNILPQCIDAMVTNVGRSGFEVVRAHPDIPMDSAEKELLESFIESPNSDESLAELHAKVVNNKESVGFAFVEVVRDQKSRPSILRHIHSHTVRLCPKDPEPVSVKYDVARGPRVSLVREIRKYRIFVQTVGGASVYFKEFGDPRKLDSTTGRFERDGYRIPKGREATELIHFRFNSPDQYGVPRWANQIPAILGSREAEEVNLRYFEENTVPPMILSVSGGRLTRESFVSLKKLLNSQGVGKERQNQILLVEAVPEVESLDGKGSVSLKIDKLTDSRPSDALFKGYDDGNQEKIRSSFRLPPVVLGLSQDVNFATANTSMFVAESQVYAPERGAYDEVYNKTVINGRYGLGLKTVKLRSKNPSITNPETLLKALTALNVMGALTPRSAQKAAASALRTEIAFYPEPGEEGWEPWMDQPIALTLRNTAQKTHDEQGVKTEETKDIEDGGDIGFRPPEHGQE